MLLVCNVNMVSSVPLWQELRNKELIRRICVGVSMCTLSLSHTVVFVYTLESHVTNTEQMA